MLLNQQRDDCKFYYCDDVEMKVDIDSRHVQYVFCSAAVDGTPQSIN
jgi:hypothetical protein